MLIWIGVTSTVLALAGLALLVTGILWCLRMDRFIAGLQSIEDRAKANQERQEQAIRQLSVGIHELKGSWESLSTEIRNRYQNYAKMEKVAERHLSATEGVLRLIRGISGKPLRPGQYVQEADDETGAAIEEEVKRLSPVELATRLQNIGMRDLEEEDQER